MGKIEVRGTAEGTVKRGITRCKKSGRDVGYCYRSEGKGSDFC